jgi:hypothetical protein
LKLDWRSRLCLFLSFLTLEKKKRQNTSQSKATGRSIFVPAEAIFDSNEPEYEEMKLRSGQKPPDAETDALVTIYSPVCMIMTHQ